MTIDLPTKDSEGYNYISYSQKKDFKAKRGFNTGLPGSEEWILKKIFGEKYEDVGWGEFGQDVEDYICYRKNKDSFSKRERSVLDKIEPLDRHQVKGKLMFPGYNFYVLLYIDDATEDLSHIRDYKTASKNSKKQYDKKEYDQLTIYSAYVKQETGKLPDKSELCIIERDGNLFRGGDRRDLTVADNVWYQDKIVTLDMVEQSKWDIINTAKKMSNIYKSYKQVNDIKI